MSAMCAKTRWPRPSPPRHGSRALMAPVFAAADLKTPGARSAAAECGRAGLGARRRLCEYRAMASVCISAIWRR